MLQHKQRTIPYFILLMAVLFSATSLANLNNVTPTLPQLLAQHQGKVIYLDFWASWCSPCRKSFPWMNEIQAKFNSDDFTVISINVDSDKALATSFLANFPANFPVVYDPDGELAQQYNVQGMPSSYLIDRSGKMVKQHIGFFLDKRKQYINEISTLIKQKTH